MVRKTGKRAHDLKALKNIVSLFHEKYIDDEKQENIPIFVNYGTNRLVLDIPMRIRNKHTFDIYSAFDKAIENRIDFRTFFEWFRGQEDYENECKVQNADLEYKDKALETVRKAMLVMMDGCTDLRVVRKLKLEMKVEKNGISLNVSQLSDGEKCTMAMFGDLARACFKIAFWQMCVTICGRFVPNEGRIGGKGIKDNALCNLNLAQISRKVGRADVRNEFSNTL